MLKYLNQRTLTKVLNNKSPICKRCFLSESFKCTEAWENRLKSPVFKNLNFGQLYTELNKCFSAKRRINVLDIDLFANGIVDNFYTDELHDILINLRKNPETVLMKESTSHAVIRWYLSMNNKSDLLNILAQRLNFGIFPDIYSSILLIDMFLKEGDSMSATKVAVLQMLQEDCNHPILRTLSLYSCLKYLNSPNIWEVPKEEENEDEDEDEVVKVRVKFSRNEYFDDHFDIINTNHLVGKTMVAFSKWIDGPIGISNHLIGLVLYEKFEEAKNLVSHIIENKIPVYKDAVEITKSYLKETPKQVPQNETEKKEDGEQKEIPQCKMDVEELLNKLDGQHLLNDNLIESVAEIVKKEVEEHEKSIIKNQCDTYARWEEERIENIRMEMEEEKKRSVISKIENVKRELEEEEQKLFYFDNEEEYQEMIKEKIIQKASIKNYASRGTNTGQDDAYIPPDISQKTFKG
ncbi:UNVERIFIED_CONTAM: hypothetical protein PYX00_010673 [Menopon gallinae]|uniref:28S ribosomal protein S27, mitochondrial n=1 Tax=Menopon gallinae TaxID=328185 RepID=A0AAW2HGD5_9NEOP